MKPALKTPFEVTVDGFVAGKRSSKGEIIELTPEQARYEHVRPPQAPQPDPEPEPEAKPGYPDAVSDEDDTATQATGRRRKGGART